MKKISLIEEEKGREMKEMKEAPTSETPEEEVLVSSVSQYEWETTHQKISCDDMILIIRDFNYLKLKPGSLESIFNYNNIVSRRLCVDGSNNNTVYFDTTSEEFAPKGLMEDKYWVIFAQTGKLPKSNPISFIVRRGDSTLSCSRILRCGSTTKVAFNRLITEEAVSKKMGKKDWIGMYRIDENASNRNPTGDNKNIATYLDRKQLPPPPNNRGTLNFLVPGVPGTFEFRLHSGDANDAVVARSETVEACMRMKAVVGRTKNERDVRIYISSAFGDGDEERKIIQDVVEPSVREFCTLINCNVEFTDVRRITSEMIGKNVNNRSLNETDIQNTMKSCLRDAMASDIFVCIIGDRYGYVAPDECTKDQRFSTIHPWIKDKRNPHAVAGLKNGCGLSLLEMEIQQKFLIPLNMMGTKSVSNCLFFFRSPIIKSKNKLHSKFDLPLRTQDRALSHLKGLIFASKAGEIYDGHDSVESLRAKLQKILCTIVKGMKWKGSHPTASGIPKEHVSMREETKSFHTMLWLCFTKQRRRVQCNKGNHSKFEKY